MRAVAAARVAAGITVPALAAATGLSKATIYAIEQGRRRPSPETASILSDALGITVLAGSRAHRPRALMNMTAGDTVLALAQLRTRGGAADVLGVSPGQVDRWALGHEEPGEDAARVAREALLEARREEREDADWSWRDPIGETVPAEANSWTMAGSWPALGG